MQKGCWIAGHEEGGGGENDEAEDDGLGGRSTDIGDDGFEGGNGRREQFVDGADEAREINAERSVGDALRQQRQHDEARHDEGAVVDAIDLLDARADGAAEDDEIERSRDDRRDEALHQGAAGARHFKEVDGADGVEVHDGFPHQAHEDVLQRTLLGLHVGEGDACRLQLRQADGDAGAALACVIGIDEVMPSLASSQPVA